MVRMRISNDERKPLYAAACDRAGRERCGQTGKTVYNTRKKALKALNKTRDMMIKKGNPATRAVRAVYLCPFCDGWHMTKLEQREG